MRFIDAQDVETEPKMAGVVFVYPGQCLDNYEFFFDGTIPIQPNPTSFPL